MADIFKDVRYSSASDIRYFIETNLGGEANLQRDDGVTILHFAALYAGNVEVVKVLVSMGANVDARADSGGTPLHVAKDAKIAKALVSLGANVNAKANDGRTPLHVALNNKDIEVAKAFIDLGADVNIKEINGLSPFDMATIYGEVEIVEACLSHGADVNAIDGTSFTPLHKAAISRNTANGRNIEMAKLLISKGANIKARSRVNDKGESYTPLDLARQIKDMPMVLYLLDNESIENIEQYIKVYIPDINSQDNDGWTLLHCAAYEQYANVTKALISNGADINICEENDLTPLDLAAGGGKVKIVEILLPYVSDVNARDKSNLTLLHKVAMSGKMSGGKNVEIAKLLVSKGADLDARTTKGTLLDMAKEVGDKAMVQYLSGVIAEKEKAVIDKILANYVDMLSKNPNDVTVYKKRGLEFLDKGYFDQAIADYTHIIQLKPDDIEAYRFRGMAYSQKKEYDKAIADFNEAIRLKPNQYTDYLSRGIAYREIRQNDQARRDLERVLELNPDNSTLSIAKIFLKEINKEEQEWEDQYGRLVQEMNKASTEEEHQKVSKKLRAMNGYKDTIELADNCDTQYRILKERREEQERLEKKRREEEEARKAKVKKVQKRITIAVVIAIIGILACFALYNSRKKSITVPDGIISPSTPTYEPSTVVTILPESPQEPVLQVIEKDYVLQYSSIRDLTDDELRYLTKEELRLARNEIYARYGRVFRDQALQEYFNSKTWYTNLPKLSLGTEPILTKLEQTNIELIQAYEAR